MIIRDIETKDFSFGILDFNESDPLGYLIIKDNGRMLHYYHDLIEFYIQEADALYSIL